MDYHNETTTLPGRDLSPWQDLGAATARTCSPPPSRARKTIPKAIHEIVGELKVRFQHTSGGDPEGFQARVALLAEDLWDSPPMLLRRASVDWVREHPFLPTASDLIKLMREALEARDREAERPAPPPGYDWAQSYCNQRNANMASNPEGRRDIEWVVVGGAPQLVPRVLAEEATLERVAVDQVDRLNRGLRKFNAPFRYSPSGWPFDVAPGDPDPTDPATCNGGQT